MRARLVGVTCVLSLLSAPAAAQDVDFAYVEEGLFEDVAFDSGWVPPASAIQLRVVLLLAGSTRVELGGTVLTTWPAPLTVTVPGRPGSGQLAMDYGLEVAVMLRFDVEVAGVRYTWSGSIPIPELPDDLRMVASTGFDPFVLPPSMPRPVTVQDVTDPVPIVRYDALGGLISIPGVGGGIAVDLQADLTVGYQTDRIVVGEASPIVEEGASTVAGPDPGGEGFGAAKDVVLHPEGTLFYGGIFRVAPTLYLTFAGTRMDYPITEIPIPVAEVDSNVIFDDRTVHVPLPDIAVSPRSVDFGSVAAGSAVERLLTISNAGEAPLEVSVREPMLPFAVDRTSLSIPPSSAVRLAVSYRPALAGSDATLLFLDSDDPDESLVVVRLSGDATGAELPVGDAGTADAGRPTAPSDDGGCGCATASARRSLTPVLLLSLAGALLRRRASRRPRRSGRAPSE